MAGKKRGLGRGLDALIGRERMEAFTEPATAGERDSALRELPVEFLQPGRYQPRRDMSEDTLAELADSIRSQGVMQPIVVRPVDTDRYEIVAGERRWRASQLAGLDSVPVVVRDVPDEAAIAMALIENIQREDLSPMEEATALRRLQEEFELTQQEVARAVGKSRTAVTNLLRLMNLNPDVQGLLDRGDLELGHAKVLLALEGAAQSEMAREVVRRGLNVRQTENRVRQARQKKTPGQVGKGAPARDPDVQRLEQALSEKVGVPVSVQYNARGKGKLTLKFNNLEELDGILDHLK